jgi:hypothetical protein
MNDDAAIDALRQLALRLLEPAGAAERAGAAASEQELVVGALPADPAMEIPLPEEARIVGSHRDRWGTTTVLLDMSLPPADAWTAVEERLTGAGWLQADHRPPGAGVLSAAPAAPRQGGTFCRSERGPGLTVRVVATPDDRSEVRLRLVPGPGLCRQAARPPGHRPLIPDLTPPPGAELVPRSGGGSDTFARATAELVTDLDVHAVAGHYAQQLEQQGWIRRDGAERDSQVWSTWVSPAGDEPGSYRLLFLSFRGYMSLHPRTGADALEEHPKLMQVYLMETRAVWRADRAAE